MAAKLVLAVVSVTLPVSKPAAETPVIAAAAFALMPLRKFLVLPTKNPVDRILPSSIDPAWVEANVSVDDGILLMAPFPEEVSVNDAVDTFVEGEKCKENSTTTFA